MKASDLMVKCLENEGLKYIFGVPGEENADFMMSLEGSSIQFILTRHEQGAAFMAEVYGRLTGEPAGCLATLGPGATNLITGVGDSNMDRAPMIVLTGQGATGRQHKESHQILDLVNLFDPISKYSTQIRTPEIIPEIVRKAFKTAEAEKPGCSFIDLPENIAGAADHYSWTTRAPPACGLPPNFVRRPVWPDRDGVVPWHMPSRPRGELWDTSPELRTGRRPRPRRPASHVQRGGAHWSETPSREAMGDSGVSDYFLYRSI